MLLSCMSFSYALCCRLGVRYVSVYVFVHIHTLSLTLVTCCTNRAAFVCVGELVIVVAFDFIYC